MDGNVDGKAGIGYRPSCGTGPNAAEAPGLTDASREIPSSGGKRRESGTADTEDKPEGSFQPRTSISGSHCPTVTWPPNPPRNDRLVPATVVYIKLRG